MRAAYRVRKSQRAPTVYQQEAVAFCCEAMRRRWDDMLGFGVKGASASTSRDVSLFVSRPQANGKTILEIVTVTHCPFCGEKIETCEAETCLAVA